VPPLESGYQRIEYESAVITIIMEPVQLIVHLLSSAVLQDLCRGTLSKVNLKSTNVYPL